MGMRTGIAAVAICLLAGTWASGQITSATISAGYSNVLMAHNGLPFYERNGEYADVEALWRISGDHLPLLGGVSVSGSMYHTSMTGIIGNFRPYYPIPLESNLGFLSAEARGGTRLSFAQHGESEFFVVPKIGVGALYDSYAADNESHPKIFLLVPHTSHHQGAAFDVRPGVQAGYSWGWGSAGLEASYMAAFGNFGGLGSTAQEVRLGAFFQVKF